MMTNNTIPNVPRDWFDRVHALLYKVAYESTPEGLEAECLGSFIPDILSAPSPAVVDGLEVVGHIDSDDDVSGSYAVFNNDCDLRDGTELVRLSDATAIIDGLRGEVERLQRAEKNDAIAYKAALERQDELRTERDQQAQRVVELEGLLRGFAVGISKLEMPTEQELNGWFDRIDAALSSGKEVE